MLINLLNKFGYVIATLLALSVPVASAETPETPASANEYKFTKLTKPVQAPGFNLEDMDGIKHSLKQYKGKVVVINFWATWCPPCIREMPSMESLYQKFKHKSFVVLAINQWEDEEKVFSFMGQIKKAPTFPILFDPDSKISAAYGVKGLPSSYIVDKKGNIVYRATGGRDFTHPAVERLIESLL